MSCDWEGNRRSGVALAVRHRLECFIHLWAHDLSKGDEHPPTLFMGYSTLFTYICIALYNVTMRYSFKSDLVGTC